MFFSLLPFPTCYLRHALPPFLSLTCSLQLALASPCFNKDMDRSKAEGKREYREEDGEEDEDDDFSDLGFLEDERKRRVIMTDQLIQSKKGGPRGGGCSATRPTCQVDYCNADLTDAKHYHKRHKVCESHAKASSVSIAGLQQRFCQQCSRFHDLPEFDDNKRSCRRRLAGHNERRRKNTTSEYHGDSQG